MHIHCFAARTFYLLFKCLLAMPSLLWAGLCLPQIPVLKPPCDYMWRRDLSYVIRITGGHESGAFMKGSGCLTRGRGMRASSAMWGRSKKAVPCKPGRQLSSEPDLEGNPDPQPQCPEQGEHNFLLLSHPVCSTLLYILSRLIYSPSNH